MNVEQNIIPIAFATDERYLHHTLVALTSILENANEATFYDVYLLVPLSISDKIKKHCELFAKKYHNCKIKTVDMGNEFSDAFIAIEHITIQTYYRLLLPQILKQYDKCIYLDGDIIACKDLGEVYSTDLDCSYVAAVLAAGYHKNLKHTAQRLNIPSAQKYINAGMLLMNLKLMRENDLVTEFLDAMQYNFSSQDQDIINKVCYPHIEILHPRFNLMTKYLFSTKKGVEANDIAIKVYGKDEINEAISDPVIIHFADKIKPWNDESVIFADEWLKYKKICTQLK